MKIKILSILSIILITLLFITGCTTMQQDDTTNEELTNTFPTTGTMSMKEFYQDINITSTVDSYTKTFDSLDQNDTLILIDSISDIKYSGMDNFTEFTFSFTDDSDGGTETKNLYFRFHGNIVQDFNIDDTVSITVHIKEVQITNYNISYTLDLFEEQWIAEKIFKEKVKDPTLINEGLQPMDSSIIKKIII